METRGTKGKKAVIAGAGPAGLTAAFELLKRTEVTPVVYEKSCDIGGISKTVNYKGNRIDIGGHRFFSKSDRVMDWWLRILPIETMQDEQVKIHYQNKSRTLDAGRFPKADDESEEKIMLIRERLSRIYFLKSFFSYPVSPSPETFKNLGLRRTMKIGFSYLKSQASQIRNEKSLEDFFINRFGKELYLTFFKDYTEKVWGIACNKISAEWGAQRIKGLSIVTAIRHALKQKFKKKTDEKSIDQKEVETSLIERFLYPKYGPGQMWEEVARIVKEQDCDIHMEHEVTGIETERNQIKSFIIRNSQTGEEKRETGDYFFSTMPVKQLILSMNPPAPQPVRDIAKGLLYRDFITVGLLLNKLKIKRDLKRAAGIDNTVKDNWIYIQEREVKVGRLQIFNNWSPFMVENAEDTVWIGMEYFCNEGDELWTMPDEKLKKFAIDELAQIDIISKEDVLDSTVLRMEKAYPAYFGTYDRFDELQKFLDGFENLFLVGRNGMHKYNNADHSMLTAMTAVDNIAEGRTDKQNIWSINTEQEYHEAKEETVSEKPIQEEVVAVAAKSMAR